ncbi:hypothetical protein [Jannaschia pohangensis]|uniref:Uncharacterized protein n=1 Tax=Jannaschia pohangensis TaxID=390807 RepID=A0A1I3PYS7_9RHOB|nr:hypothetical protein [Jannaschia pohangensis]SFJ26565.1 hypothetical protein SAMN04488095_2348 [Jannaschia pohangensis]
MADAVLTILFAGDAPRSHSIPCLVFGRAVQAVERLLQADTRAAGLPYGDPAYGRAPGHADRQLVRAIDATARAAGHADDDRYRAAAEIMHAMLISTDPGHLRDGLAEMRRFELHAYILADRTIRLSILRAAGVMESLHRTWTTDRDIEVDDLAAAHDIQGEDAWDLFADPTALMPG